MTKKQQQTQSLLDGLAQTVAELSFELWQKSDFRKKINFDKLNSIEQDRIFNELEVTILGLYLLHLDDLAEMVDGEDKTKIRQLHTDLIEHFLQIFLKLGVSESIIDDWEALIELRLKEYKHDQKMLLEHSKEVADFDEGDEYRTLWARVETITLDCVSHIRTGSLEKDDPLLKYLRKYFLILDTSFSKISHQLVFQPLGEA